MHLADFLRADRLVVPLESATLSAAAKELIERLAAAGGVSDPDRLRERVLDVLPEDLVSMGDRAFLLHYRTDAVRELCVALGTARVPICRDVGDGERQCAPILLLILAPPRLAARYLQVVGAFARFLSKPDHVAALMAQPDAASVAALPALREYVVPDTLTVRDMMTLRPRSILADTPVKEAAKEMVRARVGALPVVDDGDRVIGLLAERDLLRHLLTSYLQGAPTGSGHAPPAPPRTVRDVMTRQVFCVSPDQPLAEVAAVMANKDVERVPVVRDGRLVGFLTRGDIVRKLIGSR
jgi:CBS domain-containing protein